MLLGSGCKNILGLESGVVGTSDGAIGDDDATSDGPPGDADVDAMIDVMPDARTCFGAFQQICLTQPVPDTLAITITTVVTTCSETQTINGVPVCIRSAKHISVGSGATLQTTGAALVVLVATEDITIAGTLDGWNAGAPSCGNNDATGSGTGGPGGSFVAQGGGGGAGGSGGAAMAALAAEPTITKFRRGCSGGDGGSAAPPGGPGGLAGTGIFLVAPTIHLASTALINASGYGGAGGDNDRGGGGGGSGGLVVLDSDTLLIDAGARVLALGGGGGGGGGNAGTAADGTRSTSSTPGMGGHGGAGASGDGGNASLSTGMSGGPGGNGHGGGGGAGSVGAILATATTPTNNGTVAPALRAP